VAGRVALGSEVRIILDAAPEYVIPATVSFVASAAQFTPKTVETASERQKLMFRVRAQISQELLREHLNQVKTGSARRGLGQARRQCRVASEPLRSRAGVRYEPQRAARDRCKCPSGKRCATATSLPWMASTWTFPPDGWSA
jgi:hypothetical protein